MEEVKMLSRGNVLNLLWPLLLFSVSGSAFDFHLFENVPEVREGAIKLSGLKSPWQGRVEVYHNGKWGTVCDDGWDMAEAQVVCRQLNFPGAVSVVIGENYGQAPGPIWLDDVKCDGTEKSLFACNINKWGVSDCTHKEDVGVICQSWNRSATVLDYTHSLDHSINLADELGALFDSGTGCDFLIVLQGITGPNSTWEMTETTICAHKFILLQFPSFNTSESTIVDINLSCQTHFTSFVRYLYTRKIDVTFASAQCLHWMASKFRVKQLMEDIGRMFTQILTEDATFHTQVSLLQYAIETEDPVLQENCIQYLAWNFQKLSQSPAWLTVSKGILATLLFRTDLVVPDEYFLLRSLESWVQEKGNSSTLEDQVELLNLVRFPMISAEKLYELEVNSSLYDIHKNLYQEKMFKALQFNVLLFSTSASQPDFSENDNYQPRIYTAEPWSILFNRTRENEILYLSQSNYHRRSHTRYGSGYYYTPTIRPRIETVFERFRTPFHKSLLFKADKIDWDAYLIRTKSECAARGYNCDSVPVAILSSRNALKRNNIIFRNKLVVACEDKYICHVQDFKNNMAYVATNGTQVLACPCLGEKYLYHFVVRPEFV
ncbi:galectin-3-binding protein B-like [Nerophis lumbriciformis]|uniref:galectin-3-binding protein B-like n=1 Tax=Nerophis lumbriciformis TaxID=546530 RepID=UPI002AE01C62|nr:galectin-3-binding protein A-like [Nerophis lumbriciformis]